MGAWCWIVLHLRLLFCLLGLVPVPLFLDYLDYGVAHLVSQVAFLSQEAQKPLVYGVVPVNGN